MSHRNFDSKYRVVHLQKNTLTDKQRAVAHTLVLPGGSIGAEINTHRVPLWQQSRATDHHRQLRAIRRRRDAARGCNRASRGPSLRHRAVAARFKPNRSHTVTGGQPNTRDRQSLRSNLCRQRHRRERLHTNCSTTQITTPQ